MRKYYIFTIILALFGLALVIVGISVAGSPITQREIQLDKTRLNNFQSISFAINSYYQTSKKLPKSLEDLNDQKTSDPETGKKYDYKTVSTIQYQLCTTFSTDSKSAPNSNHLIVVPSYPGQNQTHKKGYDCIMYTLPNYVTTYYNYPTPTSLPIITNCAKPVPNPTSGVSKGMTKPYNQEVTVFTGKLIDKQIGTNEFIIETISEQGLKYNVIIDYAKTTQFVDKNCNSVTEDYLSSGDTIRVIASSLIKLNNYGTDYVQNLSR